MNDISKGSLCYLATPYSLFPRGLEAAFNEAAKITGDLMVSGINVFSPIVHSHPIAMACGLDPLDHEIWLPANQAMMNACDTLIVAKMESWETSFGIAHELDWYRKQGRRIFWLDPVTMMMERERDVAPVPPGLRKREMDRGAKKRHLQSLRVAKEDADKILTELYGAEVSE